MAKAVIIYASRSGNTAAMARAVAEGLQEAGVDVELKGASEATAEDLKEAQAIILGSPTYMHDLIGPVKTFLFEMDKAELKGKLGAAFGSYGWSGEATRLLNETMKNIFQMEVLEPGLRIKGRPAGEGLERCRQFGREIASKLR